MGLLNDLAKSGVRRFVYRAPKYLTARPIRMGSLFGPASKATALAWRDALTISNAFRTNRVGRKNLYTLSLPMPTYVSGSDRRMYHPLGRNKPAVNTSGIPVTPTDVTEYTPSWPPNWEKIMTPPKKIDWRPKLSTQLKNAPWWYGFQNADKVLICLERKMRREVMHALGVAGKSGNQKTPHYGPFSRVRC